MQLRILFLILGIAWKSWAQCPTKLVNGTDRYKGSFKITVRETGASLTNTGTSNTVLKICKGQTLDFEILTQGSTSSGYIFEFQGQELDFNSAFDNSSKSHTYTKAGTFAIILVGSSSATSYYTCQAIQVVDNPIPTFTARSCAKDQVTLEIPKDLAKNPYDNFLVDWGDGTSATVTQANLPYSLLHIYSTSIGNDAMITVTGNYTGGACSTVGIPLKVNINTPATFTPSITQLVLHNDKKGASIQFVGSTSVSQSIYQKEVNGMYQATGIESAGGANSLTVNQLDPNKQYCFQIRTASTGGCGSGISQEVCTVPLELALSTTQIESSWRSYPNASDFVSYTFSGGTLQSQDFTSITKTKEVDTEVVCGKDYCYRVTVTLKNGVKSLSNEACDDIDSNDKPESITDGYATVSAAGTLVDWKIPGGGQSLTDRIRKAEANGAFQNIPTSEVKKPFADAAVEVNRLSYCYQVAYQSTCRTNSDFSDSFCTIYASQQGDRIQWTSASPFLDKLTGYRVQVVDAQGNVIQSQNVGLQTSVSVSGLTGSVQSGYQYRIEALSENGNVSVSNVISVMESVRIYVPQAFTPNGDTQNEVFLPTMLNVTQMKLVIFDRWGNPIFASEDMNRGWDGNVNGRPAPVGSYSYRVDIRNDAGNSFTKRGTFQLIR